MVKAALTGNYGSGKSSVLSVFRALGAFCLDADRIVAGLLEDRDVLGMIKKAAGEGVFHEGVLSRERLAALVFSGRAVREEIEGILHPLVIKKIGEALSQNQEAPVAVVEIPLLYEKGYERMFDKVIAVYVDEKTALARLMAKGISPAGARQRLSVQMPLIEKLARADYVINNQGSLEETAWQAGRIFEELFNLSFPFQPGRLLFSLESEKVKWE